MERLWYYAAANDRRGPHSEAEMKDLLARGEITPATLVWSEGMADWVPASATNLIPRLDVDPAAPVSPLAPTASPAPPATTGYASRAPAYASAGSGTAPEGLRGWMQFCGIMSIIGGALQCLSCIGALVGIPMIIAGTAFTGAASRLDALSGLDTKTVDVLTRLRSGFKTMGIGIILSMVMMIIVFIFYFAIFATVLQSVGSGLELSE
jgi:hypothetical protein